MNLEDTLCQIKTNCCNIAHGWLPLLVIFDDHHPGTSMPSGGHPPHQLAASFIGSFQLRPGPSPIWKYPKLHLGTSVYEAR